VKMKITNNNEWVELDKDDQVLVGVPKHALEQIGQIVHIHFPKVGQALKKGDAVFVLESTKSAIDIYAPLSGVVVKINQALKDNVDLINHADEKEAWVYKISVASLDEYNAL